MTETKTLTRNRPGWLTELVSDYEASVSQSFLLYGNVFDTNSENIALVNALARTLSREFHVVTYAPDQGIRFPGPPPIASRVRKRLIEVLRGNQPQGNKPQSDADRLLAKANGGAAMSSDDETQLPSSPTGAISALVEFMERAEPQRDAEGRVINERVCVIIERMDLIMPPSDKALLPDPKAALLSLLHRFGTSRDALQREALLIMIAPSLEEVHSDLRTTAANVRAIQVPLPTHDERLSYAERTLSNYDVQLAEGVTLNELASQTAGLGRRHIDDIALFAMRQGGVVTRELIHERKRILMAAEYAEVLEVLETDVTLEMVGGHDLIKTYLDKYVIRPLRDPARARKAPLSLAFLGPSGTGKTFTAQALANAIGWNCVLLRPEKTKGGIVGESERRLRKAFDGIEALAPCVVFLDEIDQGGRRTEGTAGGGGDAVEANAFGAMLAFFGDQSHRGKILTVMASNRPDLIDPAFLRPGRTDDKFPFLPPQDAGERYDTLVRLLRRHAEIDQASIPTETVQLLAEGTDEWTQAELERLVLKAAQIADVEEIGIDEALKQANDRLVTSTRDIEKMTLLALRACDDRALVPEKWRSLVGREGGQTETVAASESDETTQRTTRRMSTLLDSFDEFEQE